MSQPCRLAPGGKRGRVGTAPREPSALPGAWPPAQTLASPPGAALGPLSLCQGALGTQSSPPRPGHQPSSAICLLDSERSLQDMLEHERPLKNEHVLRVSSGCRGQRPGLGVLNTACMPQPQPHPSRLKSRRSPGGRGASSPSHLLSWQVPLAEGKPPSPTAPARVTEKARPAEDRGRGQAGWRRQHSFPEYWGRGIQISGWVSEPEREGPSPRSHSLPVGKEKPVSRGRQPWVQG